MGHAITHLIVKKRNDILNAAQEWAAENMDRIERPDGRYDPCQMTIHDDQVFDSKQQAEDYIQQKDTGWYSDHAVRFRDKGKESAKMKELKAQYDRTEKAKQNFIKKHSIYLRKSDTISCPHCKSRIALAFMRTSSEKCPVCGTDLRPESTLEQIKRYKAKEAKIKKEIQKEEAKCNHSSKNIYWLVKVEVHC